MLGQPQSALDMPAGSDGVNDMLLHDNPCRQAVFLITGGNGHPGLEDGRAAVQLRRHEMHSDPGFGISGFQCAPMSVKPPVFR